MKRTLLISCLMVIFSLSFGQNPVRFSLNIAPLADSFQFIPGPQTRILVRGSFNEWKGFDYELKATPGTSVYTANYDLPGEPGDSLEYKFVIERQPGKEFWESQPNPSNKPYGNRILVLQEGLTDLPEANFKAGDYFSYPVVFAREKLQTDFLQMRDILEETHPALYDYTDKAVLDSLFDLNYARIDSAMEFSDFLMLQTEVISLVGCGHSSLWVPGAFWNVAPEGLFPLQLHIEEGRMFVKAFYADTASVPTGSEILKINGEDVNVLVDRLESLTSSDGLSPAFRTAKTAQHFSVKYALAFGFFDSFQISFRAPGVEQSQQAELAAVRKERVDECKPDGSELSMKEIRPADGGGDVAILTINTFGYYGEVDMFRSFMDSVFFVIEKKGIKRLILDLRGNGGGDPFCASYLWACLEPEPLPYFEDHYGRYDTLANPVPLAPFPFRGKLYTLIDGLCFSTTGHFCGLLKYHRVGQFVGSETGATYTCTGNATYPALDQTGIMVGTAQVGRYTVAVKGMDPRRGVIPDYPVGISQEDLITHRDPVMEKALSLAAE